jgi:hypothetical protein
MPKISARLKIELGQRAEAVRVRNPFGRGHQRWIAHIERRMPTALAGITFGRDGLDVRRMHDRVVRSAVVNDPHAQPVVVLYEQHAARDNYRHQQ